MLSILQYRSNNIIQFNLAALLNVLFLTTFVFTTTNNFIFVQHYNNCSYTYFEASINEITQ